MKERKCMKNFKIIFILILLLTMILPTICLAEYEDKIQDFEAYKGDGGSATKLMPKVNEITGIIASVGSVVSIISLVFIGIKYITGSVEERAEYKKTMIPYIIGAILVFSMTTLPMLIYKLVN